jgi:hypothetical protein
MEVQLKFHTEKEDLNELKKLQTWLADIISRRENAVNMRLNSRKLSLRSLHLTHRLLLHQHLKKNRNIQGMEE